MSPILAIRDLEVGYGTISALHGISLEVEKGEIVTLIGANGAGKTTAIRMLLGLIRPNAGEVRLFGQPLNANHLSLMRRVGALVRPL